jgi:hypothetical protein
MFASKSMFHVPTGPIPPPLCYLLHSGVFPTGPGRNGGTALIFMDSVPGDSYFNFSFFFLVSLVSTSCHLMCGIVDPGSLDSLISLPCLVTGSSLEL